MIVPYVHYAESWACDVQIDTLRQLQDRPEVVRLIDTFEVSMSC